MALGATEGHYPVRDRPRLVVGGPSGPGGWGHRGLSCSAPGQAWKPGGTAARQWPSPGLGGNGVERAHHPQAAEAPGRPGSGQLQEPLCVPSPRGTAGFPPPAQEGSWPEGEPPGGGALGGWVPGPGGNRAATTVSYPPGGPMPPPSHPQHCPVWEDSGGTETQLAAGRPRLDRRVAPGSGRALGARSKAPQLCP